MCGIYGELRLDGTAPDREAAALRCRRLAHRGPDGEGIWASGPLVLAHRRLAIRDLSPAASQPLLDEESGLALVLNGEIDNHRELARELESRGRRFRSRSDAEAVLHLYAEHGEAGLARLRGMFAFALWDGRRRRLLLGRDPNGEKPLFLHRGARVVAFASEPGPLLAHPEIPREADPVSLRLALSLHSVPAPRTAFRALSALVPGELLVLSSDGAARASRVLARPEAVEAADEPRHAGGSAALAERLAELLDAAVARQARTDVPVGVFLSGGLDSSAVLSSLRRARGGEPIVAFVARFASDGAGAPGLPEALDESAWARRAAAALHADLREVVLGPELLDELPALVGHAGQPLADPAALALARLARAARSEVTVALSGDGGDEAFAGYPRHRALSPGTSREVAERYLDGFAHFRPAELPELLEPELARASGPSAIDWVEAALARLPHERRAHPLSTALALDRALYLPDTLLAKADVATMSAGLEQRAPFLDEELVRFAEALPPATLLGDGTGKGLLRRALAGRLPTAILEREKHGFTVPLASWLLGPWRAAVEDLLLSRRARERGIVRPGAVERLLAELGRGERSRAYGLYNLLALEVWHRRFLDA